ncbi:hypothetical protein ACIBCN_41300 [Nocardia sp. NPDC051052]|uniref:hypothetical protein n=1 Tax=Nocardia sp. NPDC051052 TaxID=3364322 RepID=UPI0037B5DB1B
MKSTRFRNVHACRRYARSLSLDSYASAYELCDQLSSLRNRPIRVIEWPLPIPGPMGVWISRERDDIVVVQELATGGHRDHIVLHEIAHILCEHEGEKLPGYEPNLSLLDRVAPGDATVRFRSAYDTTSEREAELLAAAFAESMTDDYTDSPIARHVYRYFAGG